jgi:hypothetical protein
VLRLWHSGIVLEPGEDPLWVGNVLLQAQRQILFLRLPFTLQEYDSPPAMLMDSLLGIEHRMVNRSLERTAREPLWNGKVLLMREQPSR